jgi:hypothetical protein
MEIHHSQDLADRHNVITTLGDIIHTDINIKEEEQCFTF